MIYVATAAIFGTIVVTRDTRDRGKGEKGKRGKGEEANFLFPLSLLPLFIRDAFELDEWRH